jgi:PTH1 family peptidyl-tRNA hydrolase
MTTQKKILIVGLGNPGKKYEFTRHNLGFRVLERLRGELSLPAFQTEKELFAQLSEGDAGGKKVILFSPLTYMNESGKAVKAAMKKFALKAASVVVIHDDKDLKIGDIRAKSGGSSAGHKGVDSVDREIGTNEFSRYRLGIWTEIADKMGTDKFVLAKFLPEEEPAIRNLIDKATAKIADDLEIKQ